MQDTTVPSPLLPEGRAALSCEPSAGREQPIQVTQRLLLNRAFELTLTAEAITEALMRGAPKAQTFADLRETLAELSGSLATLCCVFPTALTNPPPVFAPASDDGRYTALEPDTPTPRMLPAWIGADWRLSEGTPPNDVEPTAQRMLTGSWASSIGEVRSEQQDEALLVDLSARADGRFDGDEVALATRLLGGVFDGCGGPPAGDVASILVAGSVMERLAHEETITASVLRHVLREAGRGLHSAERLNPETRGMSTTAVVAVVVPGEPVLIASCGDSRAYVLRGDELTQVTVDHNLAAEFVARGDLSAERAHALGFSHVLTRSMRDEPPEVDVFEVPELAPGDAVLLATDGLFGMIDDQEIREVWRAHESPEDACRALVERANEAGGRDNVTVVLIKG